MISAVGTLRNRWRSWFWNIFGSLCAFVFFSLSLAVTLNGGDLTSLSMMSLGAYGLITFGKSLPERATEGLNEHLRRYRATHPES